MKRFSYMMILAVSLAAVLFTSCDNDSDTDAPPVVCPKPEVTEAHKNMMSGMMNRQADVLMLLRRMNSCLTEQPGAAREEAVGRLLGGMKLSTGADGTTCKLDMEGVNGVYDYHIVVTREDSTLNRAGSTWTVMAEVAKDREKEVANMKVTAAASGRWVVKEGRCVPWWSLINGDFIDEMMESDSRTFCFIDAMKADFTSSEMSDAVKLSASGKMQIAEGIEPERNFLYVFSSDEMLFKYNGVTSDSPSLTHLAEGSLDVSWR